MDNKTQAWLKALVAVFIVGAADAIVNMGIAPGDFNLGAGLKTLLLAALFKGILGAAAYLKQSPLPGVDNGRIQ